MVQLQCGYDAETILKTGTETARLRRGYEAETIPKTGTETARFALLPSSLQLKKAVFNGLHRLPVTLQCSRISFRILVVRIPVNEIVQPSDLTKWNLQPLFKLTLWNCFKVSFFNYLNCLLLSVPPSLCLSNFENSNQWS